MLMKIAALTLQQRRTMREYIKPVQPRISPGAFGLLALIALSGWTQSSAPLDNFWYPDGPVNVVVATNGTVYLGGSFNYVGPYTGGGAVLDLASGARDDLYPRVDGAVYVATPDGSGGWFIAGNFTTAGGLTRLGLAHIRG